MAWQYDKLPHFAQLALTHRPSCRCPRCARTWVLMGEAEMQRLKAADNHCDGCDGCDGPWERRH